MQSVGMRSVGRFFRNATKSQKKVLKKRQKSIVLEERENVPKMEVVYLNVEEKNIWQRVRQKKKT